MKTPFEVDQLIGCFYTGSRDGIDALEEWVESVVRFHRSEKQKAVIKPYLDELLSGQYSDVQLEDVWNSASPGYKINRGGHRTILALIRDALERGTGTR